MNHKTTTLTTPHPARFQVRASVAVLLAACVFPLLIHGIPPYQGIPIGAILLPMFYVPLIALFFFRLHVAFIAAALSPVINFLLTGNPQWEIVAILSFELIIFVGIAYKLLQIRGVRWIAAPLAYLLTKVVSSTALWLIPLLPENPPVNFFLTSVRNGFIGILLLGLLTLVLVWYRQSQRLFR